RGVYALADREPDELESLAVVAQRAPNAIFCLLTALRFHGLTTQAPREIWIGIAKQRNPPPLTWPPLRVVRFSGVGLTLGVETHIRNGLPLKVTGIARTVVDCFKFRNKIGLDVALESLSEVRRNHRATIDDIWKTAAPLRMTNVMRPYLESLA
ncbi:MAG: hypothetical protein KDA29_15520, partial [Phycisphaerales bacterium]|nr:hypothetical protein [Phycisphaerales bacterium]